jgi:L-lactate dehydrogenase complex protein LldG
MNREDFLERVRTATGRSPKAPPTRPPLPPQPSAPQTPAQLAERFKLEHERVLGEVHLVHSIADAGRMLATLLEGKQSFIRSSHAILDEVGIGPLIASLEPLGAAHAEVGITGCEGGIAATGSVGFSSVWGRLAALLPYHHVIVLRADQLVPDLEDWYLKLALTDLPSAWGMHTGPSKSADIEQTMALGVHGPGKVDVILLLEDGVETPTAPTI